MFRILLLGAFLLSGAASLVFEVIWTRILLVSVGATATAVGAVLGAFMGGMAIGSALAGRSFLRRRDAVITYAFLEGLAGIYGLATPFLLRSVDTASTTVEIALAVLALLPATIAMGASLPILARALGEGSDRPAVEVGHLYAANTAGAFAGPLVCVFWLFPTVGLTVTLHVAAGADLVLFATLLVARKLVPRWEKRQAAKELFPGPRPAVLLLAVMALSGATAMVYETAWSRTLSMVYGSSIYGVSIMLSTFLLGIAGGSALASVLLRRREKPAPATAPAWLLVASACSAFASLLIARLLPLVFVSLYSSSPQRDTTLFLSQFAVSLLLVLPATLSLGAMLPVAASVVCSEEAELGRQVSWLYTSNLVGSAAGALAAAGLMLGSYGIEDSVIIASVLGLVLALIVLAASKAPRLSPARVAALTCTILFVVAIDPGGEPVAKGIGFYTDPMAFERQGVPVLREIVDNHQLLYYRDGPTATVAVHRVGRFTLLKINGKTDASDGPGDLETELLLGHLPLMAAEAKRVAIIGWGSGITAGAVLQHDVETVDAFEIEPAVIEASQYFHSQNGRPLEDPRLRLILGDARSLLRREVGNYDLIISEPSNPWITGVSNLFTREFFELAAARLVEDGILCQWFHLYGMSADSVRSLLATLRSVFPHAIVFKDRDWIVLGSRRPIAFDLSRMALLFNEPRIKESLSLALADYPADLLVELKLDEKGVETFSSGAELNTDDNMLVELAAPRSLYRDTIPAILAELDRHSSSIVDHVTGYDSPADIYVELAATYFTDGRKEEALRNCRRALEIEASFEAHKLLGQILESMGRTDEARQSLEKALTLGGDPQGRRFVEAFLRSLASKGTL